MDFGMLPPEVNSARMYSGPGSGSMMAAAAAWDGLAAELQSTAASYSSVITGLTTAWQGPSSAMMAAAATPYARWLTTTAAQAEQTATAAKAAAAAYEAAFAGTVPPPVIAANRAQLASLVSTNVFGQNTAAIAANEAQYATMWAQDAAAMYGYAGQSASAAQVMPFSPPSQTTNPASQAAAVGQAAGTSAGTNAQSVVSQLTSATPGALQSLATPGAAAPAQAVSPPSPLDIFNFLRTLATFPVGGYEALGKAIVPANDAIISTIMGLVIGARSLNGIAVAAEPEIFAALPSGPLAAGLGSASNLAGSTGSAMSAGLGSAGTIGALSVPPSWAAATPTVRLAASMLQGTSAAAAPAVTAAGTAGLFGQMGMASLAGGAVGAALPRAVNVTAVRSERGSAGADESGKGNHGKKNRTPEKLKHVLAEMSQDPESLQHWYTDKEHLDGLLEQLSNKPGYHAVHLSKGNKPKPTPPKARWG